MHKSYNVSNRSWGYRPLRKLEVQSYLASHSLLDNRRITKKLFTKQDKEFSTFIPSNPSTTMKAKHCIIKLIPIEVSCKNIHSLAKDQGTDIKVRQTNWKPFMYKPSSHLNGNRR